MATVDELDVWDDPRTWGEKPKPKRSPREHEVKVCLDYETENWLRYRARWTGESMSEVVRQMLRRQKAAVRGREERERRERYAARSASNSSAS